MTYYHGTDRDLIESIRETGLETGELTPDLAFAWAWAVSIASDDDACVLKFRLPDDVVKQYCEVTPYRMVGTTLQDVVCADVPPGYLVAVYTKMPKYIRRWLDQKRI